MPLTPGPETKLDKKLVPKVKALVERLGMTARFHISTNREWDPDLQDVVSDAETTVDIKVTPPEPFLARDIDGTVVQLGDMRIYLPAKDLTFEPKPMMKVELEGSELWFITDHIGRIKTGEKLAMYSLGLRRTGFTPVTPEE